MTEMERSEIEVISWIRSNPNASHKLKAGAQKYILETQLRKRKSKNRAKKKTKLPVDFQKRNWRIKWKL